MKGKAVIIVGNGFDVGHGLPSRYSNFKEWLLKNDIPLFEFLERYIDISGDWWNDFERNLCEIDVPKLIRETPLDNQPRDTRFPPSFSHPARWRLDEIRDRLSHRFTEWISLLDNNPVSKKIELPQADFYISFNYTDTLERVYGVSEDRILYIHGKASRGDELIYGHGKNQYQLERDIQQKYSLYESDDFFKPGSYGDSESELTMGISYMEKEPYNQLVKYREKLVQTVSYAETIYVYGLSFSEVDFPYIEWIALENANLRWKVSWHSENDKRSVTSCFEELGVKEYELFYLD